MLRADLRIALPAPDLDATSQGSDSESPDGAVTLDDDCDAAF